MNCLCVVAVLSLAIVCHGGHTPPPEEVPAQFEEAFSMNGEVPIEKYYVDDSEGGKGTHYKFGAAYIKQLLETWKGQDTNNQLSTAASNALSRI